MPWIVHRPFGPRADVYFSSGTTVAVTADSIAASEFLSGVRRDATAVMLEILASIQLDRRVPIEFSGTPVFAVVADAIAKLEFLAGVRADASAPIEILARLVADSTATAEISARSIIDLRVPIEIIAGIAADGIAPFEISTVPLFPVTADARALIEVIGSLGADSPAYLELLAQIVTDRLPPFEFGGILTVSADSLAPFEFGGLAPPLSTTEVSGIRHRLLPSPLFSVRSFSPLAPGEADTFVFDFTAEAAGAVIASTSWTCALAPGQSGYDPAPQTRVLGSSAKAQIEMRDPLTRIVMNLSGQFSVASIGGLPMSANGSTYIVEATAILTDGRVLTLSAPVLCSFVSGGDPWRRNDA